ncbi:hypothetical protein FGIG_11391 [Fasciola gigantica]|uniref:Uncharacterized protein n=1 Tax=Fasciola gigantica TaxID=46835 RepID=A0A504YGU4_FASGI|nr:hypothetical protein FGIG_11391 [Fasciola gigantica]
MFTSTYIGWANYCLCQSDLFPLDVDSPLVLLHFLVCPHGLTFVLCTCASPPLPLRQVFYHCQQHSRYGSSTLCDLLIPRLHFSRFLSFIKAFQSLVIVVHHAQPRLTPSRIASCRSPLSHPE